MVFHLCLVSVAPGPFHQRTSLLGGASLSLPLDVSMLEFIVFSKQALCIICLHKTHCRLPWEHGRVFITLFRAPLGAMGLNQPLQRADLRTHTALLGI